MRLFRKAADFAAMQQVLEGNIERTKARLLAYCLMSNHCPANPRSRPVVAIRRAASNRGGVGGDPPQCCSRSPVWKRSLGAAAG
jgi:hypothetical protein